RSLRGHGARERVRRRGARRPDRRRLLAEDLRQAQQAGKPGLGDVALDAVRGGTIVSTEEIFDRLADALQPTRIVLAGEVDGIFTADPQLDPTAQPIASITPETLAAVVAGLGGSHGVDVTGGMYAKVMQSLAMVQRHPGMEIVVCSGMEAAHVRYALAGAAVGTRIYVQEQAHPVSASTAMRL
ncbi:MAG: hypothetical protein ACK47M_12625, partial [Caldilinea sp.]